MDAAKNPLELDEATLTEIIEQTTQRILHHLETLPQQHAAYDEDPETIAQRFHEPHPPDEPTPPGELLDHLFNDAIPPSLNTPHPGYLAYIPGGGLPHAAIADLISDTTNRYIGTNFAAPALTRIEANVIEWFCRIVNYPNTAFGILTTGGSMANQTAITTARHHHLGETFLNGTVYASDQTHHSITKSCTLAGIPQDNVKKIPTDNAYRIDPNALETTIHEDRSNDLDPFLIVANAGTTNTGAIDPLPQLATLAEQENLWLHADAAYGGFFTLTPDGEQRLSGIEKAHSITLDPHKGLFLPYGTGCLLVKDPTTLQDTHTARADYLPNTTTNTLLPDFSHLSPELSRDFRGLRIWLPLKMHGLEPFKANLQEKLDLARFTHEQLQQRPHITITAKPQLSTLAFRWEPPHLPPDDHDHANQDLLNRINKKGNVHISGTTLNDAFTLRVSILSFRTHQEHIQRFLTDLDEAIQESTPEQQR